MTNLARPNVMKMRPYQPGKPIEEAERESGLKDFIKLASNENPIGPSPFAIKAIESSLSKINLYPDGAAFQLKTALAEHLQTDFENLIVGNGSDELISFIGLAYLEPDDEVVIGNPSFVRYDAVAELNNSRLLRVSLTSNCTHDLLSMRAAVNEKTKLVFIANPNNPTGTIVNKTDLITFLDSLPSHVLTVLDEAYFEYVEDPDYPDGQDLIEKYNIIALRTFSKAYGLAGARVGYGIARPELIDPLERIRAPFNVNSIAQFAAAAAIKDKMHLTKTLELNRQGKKLFYETFDRMNLNYVPSEANFVMIDTGVDSSEIYNELLQKGVIIRPCKPFGYPQHIRVTIGTEEENHKFLTQFERILNSKR